ncbi:MAG TPA: hypothetical protein VL651_12555 [Bacteroidia bacterium]|jgi:hypothetical protein|nr:hypothetical protein [Bacteroidia bacterium]
MRLPHFILLFFLSALFSCTSETPANNKIVSQFTGVLPQVIQNDSALLHGLRLGMNIVEVKKAAHDFDSLAVEQPDYLQFEHRISARKSFTYDCEFDKNGLSAITMDIFLEDEKNGDSLYDDFEKYFTLRFGKPDESGTNPTWTANIGNRPAKIELEEDEGYMYGKLTIWFYDATFDAPSPDGDTAALPVI